MAASEELLDTTAGDAMIVNTYTSTRIESALEYPQFG
jgi:hypothetical protein